jgi:beta-glucosidase
LPPVQQQLLRRVYEANPKTVVVLVNGGPLSLTGSGPGALGQQPIDVPAVVEMFMAGEEGGNAVADVLFGDYNPSGKLPYTVCQSVADLPPMDEYDITKGFTYMYFEGRPLYPFGHGLSYTTFNYTNLGLSSNRIPGNGQVTVRIDVQNTGQRGGDEVVQLYVRDVEASVKRPRKELRGFERISLKPGEKQTVSFPLPAEKLSFWDAKKKAFVVEPGAFEVLVGSSSEDIRAKGRFEVTTAGVFKD